MSPSKSRERDFAPANFSDNDTYLRADFAEIICILNLYGSVTRSTILERLDLEDDINEDIEEFDDVYEENMTTEIDEIGSFEAELDDMRETLSIQLMQHLRMRMMLLGDRYPFTIEGNNLITLQDDLNYHQMAYISLLIGSALYGFKEYMPKITKSFERISADALKNILPDSAEVHNFGSGVDGVRISSKFLSAKLFDRIEELGTELRARVLAVREDFSNRNHGDDGLDIVAWIPANDKLQSFITIFGQCACTHEWVKKQHECSMDVWSNSIKFPYTYTKAIFIPFWFRNSAGDWHSERFIRNSVMFDRLRIIKNLPCDYASFALLPAHEVVEDFLNSYEEIA